MRTDNDTWDITTSVGSTALFVAAARALEAQKPDPLAVDPYAEVFCRAVGGAWADVLDGKAPDNKLMTEFGTHFVNFQGARTRYFDDYFARAVAAGVRQIVIIAAGLDSRAYRLDWPDGTVIYELDQPQVLEFKRGVLAERGDKPRAKRVEIAVDLRDDWPQALRDNGFDDTRPAAFIAEGLMIYLPATAQGELFRGIDALAAPGSFVAIEEGEPMPDEVFQAVRRRREGGGRRYDVLPVDLQRTVRPGRRLVRRSWLGRRGHTIGGISRAGRPGPAGWRIGSWRNGQIKHDGQRR